MEELKRKAQACVKECQELLDSNGNGNIIGMWMDIRDITGNFIDSLPEAVLEIMRLHDLAIKRLDDLAED